MKEDVPGPGRNARAGYFQFDWEIRMSSTTETERDRQSFAEAALRLGGKSDEEARRMGAVDKADEQVDPMVAGLASVHGCIGAVDPVRTFGTPEQKNRLLPRLASGEALSAFALTEPCAGSDLTALRTTAALAGDHYEVTGEKLFITNSIPGRLIGLVVLLEGKPAVLIAELPDENEHFQIRKYGLYALKHAYNQGLIFNEFRVPRENLLMPKTGDGLT